MQRGKVGFIGIGRQQRRDLRHGGPIAAGAGFRRIGERRRQRGAEPGDHVLEHVPWELQAQVVGDGVGHAGSMTLVSTSVKDGFAERVTTAAIPHPWRRGRGVAGVY